MPWNTRLKFRILILGDLLWKVTVPGGSLGRGPGHGPTAHPHRFPSKSGSVPTRTQNVMLTGVDTPAHTCKLHQPSPTHTHAAEPCTRWALLCALIPWRTGSERSTFAPWELAPDCLDGCSESQEPRAWSRSWWTWQLLPASPGASHVNPPLLPTNAALEGRKSHPLRHGCPGRGPSRGSLRAELTLWPSFHPFLLLSPFILLMSGKIFRQVCLLGVSAFPKLSGLGKTIGYFYIQPVDFAEGLFYYKIPYLVFIQNSRNPHYVSSTIWI